MNTVQLTGRLVSDPQHRTLAGGTDVTTIRIAVDGGARNNETGFFNVVSYGNGAKAAANTLAKGWLVAVSGRLEHRTWKDGEKNREAIDIVGHIEFLSEPKGKDLPAEPAAAPEDEGSKDEAPAEKPKPKTRGRKASDK